MLQYDIQESSSYKKETGQDFSVDSLGLIVTLHSVQIIIMIIMS